MLWFYQVKIAIDCTNIQIHLKLSSSLVFVREKVEKYLLIYLLIDFFPDK